MLVSVRFPALFPSEIFSTYIGSFLYIGSLQGLHNIHGNYNVPNLAGTLGSRNSGLNGVPSAGVQQQNGSISNGRFASSNIPVALSQVQSCICVDNLKIMKKNDF